MTPLRPLAVVVLALCASVAQAQVFKCVDASGNVTYQQEPCTGPSRGAPVELRTDNAQSQDAADRDGRWRIAAEQGNVITGMPKRWVQQALGQPGEIRRGTVSEAVPEVWAYSTPRGPLRVGFRGNAVEWARYDNAAGPAGNAFPDATSGTSGLRAATPGGTGLAGGAPVAGTMGAGSGTPGVSTAAAPGGPSVAGESARSRVSTDRRCDEVLAELGPATRREALQASGERPVEAVRYAYDPLPGGLPLRLAFTCIDGRVANVSRDIAR
jgi:hypothetical protein